MAPSCLSSSRPGRRSYRRSSSDTISPTRSRSTPPARTRPASSARRWPGSHSPCSASPGQSGSPRRRSATALLQISALFSTSRLPSLISDEAPGRGSSGSKGSGLTLGLRIVAQNPTLTGLMMLALATNVLVMPYLNLMPVFARDELDIGSSGLGLLLACAGLGTVGGALFVARASQRGLPPGAQVITATAFAGLVLMFALTPIVPLAALLLFAAGW